jgi:hypothetical protein
VTRWDDELELLVMVDIAWIIRLTLAECASSAVDVVLEEVVEAGGVPAVAVRWSGLPAMSETKSAREIEPAVSD